MTIELHCKIVNSSTVRTETYPLVTGAEAALATVIGGARDAVDIVIQRGRRANLYWPKVIGAVNADGYSDILDQATTGSNKPIRALLWLGQSDADGRATLGTASLDSPDPSVATRCTLLDQSFDYGTCTEPSSDTSGIILAPFNDPNFAASALTRTLSLLALQDADHEYLGIPCCFGGTSSQDWQGGIASPIINTTLIGGAVFRALAASRIFAARGFQILGVVAGQMTSNGGSAALAARWASDWDALTNYMQAQFAGLYMGSALRVCGWKAQAVMPPGLAYLAIDWANLRLNQDTWVTTTRKLAEANSNLMPDNIHMDATGEIQMADDTAAVFISNGWLS